MCDQTQVSYLPGDVVWVKLSPLWWPGQIVAKDEIDENIIKNLKSLVAVVKFFEEDTYEFVKNLSNIYHYNCLRKVEFIKKGLNALRSGIKGSSSNVKRFPEDVIAAEVLTGGNPNVLNDDIFQPEEKVDYKDLFPSASSKKTPKRPRLSETTVKQKESPYGTSSPAIRTITHPRFIKSNLGLESNHDVKILIQKSCVSNDSPAAESSPTIYKCHACNFTTVRINVLILHNRSHWQNCDSSKNGKKKEGRSGPGSKNKSKIFSFVNQTPTGTKRKSETAGSLKKKLSSSADKTNRNSQTATTNQTLSDTLGNKAPDSDDNLHDSLLEDWMEYENLVEGDSKVDCVQIDDQTEKIANDDVKLKNKMSCFDFDETEDDSATVDSDSLYKRKIPRQIRERKLYSDVAECVPAVAAVETAAATTDTESDDCRARNSIDRNKRIHEDSSELENASVDEKIINDLKRLSDEINVERLNKFIDEVGSAALKPINIQEKNEEPLVTTLNRDDGDSIEGSVNRRADNDRADDEDEVLYVNTGSDKYSSLNNTARTVEIVSGNSGEHRDRSVKITNSDMIKNNVSDENYALRNGFVNNENVEEECLPTSNMVERSVELVSADSAIVNDVNPNMKGNTKGEVVTTGHANENILRPDFVNTENGEFLSVNYALNGIVLEQDLTTTKNTNSIADYAKNELIIADDRLNEKLNVPWYDLINTEKTPNGVEKLANNVLDNTEKRDSTTTDVNSNLHTVTDNVFVEHTKFLSLGTNRSVDKSNSSSVQEKIVSFNENCVHEISEEGEEESKENYFKNSEEFSVTAADNDKIGNNLKTAAGVVMAEQSTDSVTTITDGSNDVTQVRNLDHNIIISNIAEIELPTMSSDECVNAESERDHGKETIIISSSDGIDRRKDDNEISCKLKNDNELIKNHEGIKTSSTSCAIVIQSIRQLTVDTVGKNILDQRKMDGILPEERELTTCSMIGTHESIAGSSESFGNEEKLAITPTLCNARVQLDAGINDFDDDDEDTQEDTNLLREEIDQLISQPESTLQDVDLHDDEAAAADGDEMRFEDFLKFNKRVQHNRDQNKTEFKDFVESAESLSLSSIHRNVAYSNNVAGNYSETIGETIGPNRNVILEAAKLVGESTTNVKMIALNDANNDDIGCSAGYNIYTFVDRKTGQQKQYILSEQQRIALLREQLASVNKLKVVTSNTVDNCTSSIETIVPPADDNSLYNLDVTHQRAKQTLINDGDNSRQLYVASYEHIENPSNVHQRTMLAPNVASRVVSENPIIVQYKSDRNGINDSSAQSTSFAIISASPTICRSYADSFDGSNTTNNTNVVDNESQNQQLQKLSSSSYQLIPAKLNKDVQAAAAVNDAAAVNVLTKQDILAKALECTNVLHPSHQIYDDLNYDGRTKSTNLTLKQTPIMTPAEKSSSTGCTFSSIEDFTWATQH